MCTRHCEGVMYISEVLLQGILEPSDGHVLKSITN
jgi:hypothetical protein